MLDLSYMWKTYTYYRYIGSTIVMLNDSDNHRHKLHVFLMASQENNNDDDDHVDNNCHNYSKTKTWHMKNLWNDLIVCVCVRTLARNGNGLVIWGKSLLLIQINFRRSSVVWRSHVIVRRCTMCSALNKPKCKISKSLHLSSAYGVVFVDAIDDCFEYYHNC